MGHKFILHLIKSLRRTDGVIAVYRRNTTTYRIIIENKIDLSYTVGTGGGKTMDIEIKLEESRKTPKVIILTDKITDEVSELVQRLKTSNREIVSGIKDGCVEIINVASLIRIYSADKKVMIRTDSGEFLSRQRLYEFEEILDSSNFVRISNSEIVNLKKIKNLDLSLSGTICVKFLNGETTFASRRYVARLKNILGI